MALQKHSSIPDTQAVCRIYVILKYRKFEADTAHHSDSTIVLKEPVTLKISDFPSDSAFDFIYFSENPLERWYKYPSWILDPITAIQQKLMPSEIEGTHYEDRRGGQGVQFCIDWLISDTLCTLYIDNIEVYDNDGWDQYIEHPEAVVEKITTYALNFKNAGWDNLKYWMGGHEPTSIDAYTPIKTVDEILQANDFPPLMNTIWALWNQDLNGEAEVLQFYKKAILDKFRFNYLPKELIRKKYLEIENLK